MNTVIFDLGGVLVDFHPYEGMKNMGFSDETAEAFMEGIFSGFWEECDSIVYEPDEIRRVFKDRLPGYEREVDILWDKLPMITGMRPYAMEWIESLKARGMKLYVLSNFGNVAFDINSQVYEFLPLMDGKVISYELGITKPDRRIYEALYQKYDIDPKQAVFIDDRRENVDGAIAAGMKGILFESYEQAKEELGRLMQQHFSMD